MKKTPKQIIIKKQGTSSDYTTSEYFNDTYTDTISDDTSDQTNIKNINRQQKNQKKTKKSKEPKEPKFKSIVGSTYRKPRYGTAQDNYTKEYINI